MGCLYPRHRILSPAEPFAMTSPLCSMTGFATATGGDDGTRWTVDARSVNGKGLDVRLRLPPGFDALEAPIRALVARRFTRGSVSLSVSLEGQSKGGLRVDRALVADILALHQELTMEGVPAAPSLENILAIRGVLTEAEGTGRPDDERQQAIVATVTLALEALADHRAQEGAALADVAAGHLARLAGLCAAAAGHADAQPAALRARLQTQLAQLMEAASDGTLDRGRLEQELALQAVRADVREELDRLAVHLQAMRDALAGGSPVGKRLDFLCQELNREANTLCSKSVSAALTQIGLELKLTIDRLREQVANVE